MGFILFLERGLPQARDWNQENLKCQERECLSKIRNEGLEKDLIKRFEGNNWKFT